MCDLNELMFESGEGMEFVFFFLVSLGVFGFRSDRVGVCMSELGINAGSVGVGMEGDGVW